MYLEISLPLNELIYNMRHMMAIMTELQRAQSDLNDVLIEYNILERENKRLQAERDSALENVKKFAALSEGQLKLLESLQAENARLREALERLSLYVACNGDDWVQREARAALAKFEEFDK
jgi:septal ring factor EnvC (AmiA/AmiB activator)